MATNDAQQPAKHTAGAFDIRNIIGGLLSIYGVVLVAMGLFGDTESDKTDGVNANLYAGIGLLVVGFAFLAWARLRPVVVPADAGQGDASADAGSAPH